MPAYTFFYDGPLFVNGQICLDEDESHHLSRVMRLQSGDVVDLINGRGSQYEAQVISTGRHCQVLVKKCIKTTEPARYQLEIVQGLPGLNKTDWIVEKLTELGIDRLTFFGAERSGRQQINEHQLAKLRAKCIAACKQSGRLWLPEVRWIDSLQCFEIPKNANNFCLLTLDPCGKALDYWQDKGVNLIAFIGPEAGLSSQELEWLDGFGAHRICIHENILRSETASIATGVLLHHLRSRFL